MTTWEFDDLVARQEKRATAGPTRFRLEVFWFVVLGYIFLAACLLLPLLLIAGWFCAYLSFPAYLNWYLVSLSFVVFGILIRFAGRLCRRPPPQPSIRLPRSDHPEIYDATRELLQPLQAPPVHEIKIDGEINAAARFEGWLSLIGLGRPVLHLGAPLIAFLSTEQLKVVIAHELAHFAAGHFKFGWLYQVQYPWTIFNETITQWDYRTKHYLTKMMLSGVRPFIRWYFPRLQAYYRTISRMSEALADSTVTKLFEPKLNAGVLLQIAVLDWFDRPFLRSLERQARRTGVPPSDLTRQRIQGLSEAIKATPLQAAVWQVLGEEQTSAHTHPILGARIAVCGVPNDRLNPAALGELTGFLTLSPIDPRPFVSRGANLLDELDAQIYDALTIPWAQASAQMRNYSRRLEALEEKQRQGAELTSDESSERLQLIELFGPRERYHEEICKFSEKHPNRLEGRFLRALLDLDRNDPTAVSIIEECMQKEPGYTFMAISQLEEHYAKQLNFAEANRYAGQRQSLLRQQRQLERAKQLLRKEDTFTTNSLPSDEQALLVAELTKIRLVRRAYLVTKRVDADQSFNILGLKLSPRWIVDAGHYQEQINQLTALIRTLPFQVVFLEKAHARLESVFRKIPNADLIVMRRAGKKQSGATQKVDSEYRIERKDKSGNRETGI